ncbi:MAG: hypothetical protein PHF05_04510 [Candidatus Izemoplasmatales bacterium]|nr:hypothetical protein [Candidatus Izemoplasmatales bacterium]
MNSVSELVVRAAIEARILLIKVLCKAGFYEQDKFSLNFDSIDFPLVFGPGGYAVYYNTYSIEKLNFEEEEFAKKYAVNTILQTRNFIIIDKDDEFFEVNDRDSIAIVSPLELIKGDELKFFQTKMSQSDFLDLIMSQQYLWDVMKYRDKSYNSHKSLTRTMGNLIQRIKSLIEND